MSAKTKRSHNPGSSDDVLEATLLISMFKESIEMNVKLTSQMGMICECLKKNTDATNKLLNHLSSVPAVMKRVKDTVSLIKWGLIPTILSLIGLVAFFASK